MSISPGRQPKISQTAESHVRMCNGNRETNQEGSLIFSCVFCFALSSYLLSVVLISRHCIIKIRLYNVYVLMTWEYIYSGIFNATITQLQKHQKRHGTRNNGQLLTQIEVFLVFFFIFLFSCIVLFSCIFLFHCDSLHADGWRVKP